LSVVENDPQAIERRLSRHESHQTALHYVVAPPDGLIGGGFRDGTRYDMIPLLVELGADVSAEDAKGRTALDVALLKGEMEAARRLRVAGARVASYSKKKLSAPAELAGNIDRVEVMLTVSDIQTSIDWYRSIGFQLAGVNESSGKIDWAGMRFGRAFFMLVSGALAERTREVSVWVYTRDVDALYQTLKARQLARATALLDGQPPTYPEARFSQDLHEAFYGNREFTLVDPDGYSLTFGQPSTTPSS
jgi:hypothetical protein